MVQASTTATQSPVTPSRQLGVARGPRRTPASRTKKPYARPGISGSIGGNGGNDVRQTEYQTDAGPSFLRGMRSLVARLWGTSLKSSPNSATSSPATADYSSKCKDALVEIRPAAAQPAVAGSSSVEADTLAFTRHAATTAGERTRASRPTAESVFAPSPFAYNKKLATATPSVANLRDVERVKDQSPAYPRRHSVGRIDLQRPRLSTGTSLSEGHSESADSDNSSQYMSPSSARRLLNSLSLINTPILEARCRVTSGQSATVGVAAGQQFLAASGNAGERNSAMPLRRLPVSLLALSDTPNKIHRSPLGDPANVLDKDVLRRSRSARGSLRSQNTAPSLARTIQMKQARKAVAERLLLQSTSTGSSHGGTDAGVRSATQSPMSIASESFDDATTAGNVRPREDDEGIVANKRRRAAGGEAVKVADGKELDSASVRVSSGRIGRLKRLHGQRLGRAGRSQSLAESDVKWRFSARLDPLSDNEADSSSESDDDREALAAKVPLSKIRGGELIGLSLRPTTSAQSVSSSAGASAVRSTGFGSNRMPIPLFSEPEPEAKAEAESKSEAVAVPVSATAPSTTTSAAAVVPAPTLSFATSAPEAAPAPKAAETASTGLFGSLASKPEQEKPAGAPMFSFGKATPAPATDKPANAPDNVSEAATAPTTPVFTFASTSAADTTPSAKAAVPADTWGKSSAPSGIFSVKPAATANTTSATTPELLPKPATSVPTFSFGSLSKAAASSTSTTEANKPAATPPLFSFGSTTAAAAVTSAAEEKPKSDVKFSFGSFGVAPPAGTPAQATPADKPAQSLFGNLGTKAASDISAPSADKPAPSMFGQLGTSGTSAAPTAFGAKRALPEEKSGAASAAAPKPAFSFGSSSAGGSFASATPPVFGAPVPGAPAGKDSSAGGSGTSSTAAFGAKPSGGFSFGSAAPATTTTSFSFGLSAKPSAAPPEKVIDTTMDASDDMMATSAAPSFGLTSNAPAVAASNVFSFSGASSTASGAGAAVPAASSTSGFGLFGQANKTPAPEPATKKPLFTFGSVSTPGAASFESTNVTTPAVPSFGNPAAAAPTPSFGFGGASSSSAATPSTTAFNFGSKPTLQTSNTFGSISSQMGTSGFGAATTSQSSGSVFGNPSSSSGFGHAPAASTGGFGSSGGLGFGSGTGAPQAHASVGVRNVSSGSFTFGQDSLASSSAFGQSVAGGGFGHQQQQPGASGMPSFSSQPGGFGPSVASNQGFGASSNTSTFGVGSSAAAPAFSFGQSNQTPSTAGFGFNSGAPTSSASIPPTPFAFTSNASVQDGGSSAPFQFSAGGVAQHSATGVSGGMSLGRVTGASNASASSQGRRIARARRRN